jgi:hypothetical protein
LADDGLLTLAQLKSYFKFCFVRNPWDRLISEIFCRWMSPWFADMSVEQRIRHACTLAATPTGIGNHLRPQHDFVSAAGLQMDFIGRFEHLEEDFGQLCRLLNIPSLLPHLNRSVHQAYQEYYNVETQALTADTYRRDIDAFQYKFEEALAKPVVLRKMPGQVDTQPTRAKTRRMITAYPLVDQAVPLKPAAGKSEPTPTSAYAPLDLASASRQGWQLCCPLAFTATWNGGPTAADIEIHLAEDTTVQAAFVQSNLGQGLLTFYAGYQFKSEGEHLLWVRGPLNAPKDGLYPLERMVDASLLPCTVAAHWQFTCPGQTIRFATGEPFATLLLYPKSSVENVHCEIVQFDNSESAYAQDIQKIAETPDLQSLFQRLGAIPTQSTEPKPSEQ